MKRVKKTFVNIFDFSLSSKVAFLLFCEILLGFVITFGTLLIFLKIGKNVLEREIISFDQFVTHFIYSFRSPFMNEVMGTISFLGGDIFLSLAIIVAICILLAKHKKDALVFAFILVTGIGLNIFLKNFFQRARPDFFPLFHEPSYSFPSAHAMNATVFYLCVAYFIFWHLKNRKLGITLIVIFLLLIFLIGISRIYLGVHFPSDVLGGFVAGLCWFTVVLLFEKTIIFFKLFRKRDLKKTY